MERSIWLFKCFWKNKIDISFVVPWIVSTRKGRVRGGVSFFPFAFYNLLMDLKRILRNWNLKIKLWNKETKELPIEKKVRISSSKNQFITLKNMKHNAHSQIIVSLFLVCVSEVGKPSSLAWLYFCPFKVLLPCLQVIIL